MITPKTTACIWLVLFTALLAASLILWPKDQWLKTSFNDLLPEQYSSLWHQRADTLINTTFETKTFWLSGAKTVTEATNAAKKLAQQLKQSALFSNITLKVEIDLWQKSYREFYPSRLQFITKENRYQLETEPQAYFNHQLALIYGPTGSMYANQLERDTTGLFTHFFQQQAQADTKIVDDIVVFNHENKHYALVIADTRNSSLNFHSAKQLLQLYHTLKASAIKQGFILHATGAPLFAAAGSVSGQKEVSRVGSFSIVAILLLLLVAFMSFRPIAITLLNLAAGTLGGLAITVLINGSIHIITLVFGAAIIGISVDYSFHYLCGSLLPKWRPFSGLLRILPGLFLGMISSVIAFLCLSAMPFPGIRQMGIFMASGLLCSWLSVVLLAPFLMTNFKTRAKIPAFMQHAPRIQKHHISILSLLLLFCICGSLKTTFSDDIRAFYAKPPALHADEQAFQDIIPGQPDSRYIIVTGKTTEHLLQNEELILQQLDTLLLQQPRLYFNSISRLLPSLKRQKENLSLQKNIIRSKHFSQYLKQLGYTSSMVKNARESLLATPFKGLEFNPSLGFLTASNSALFLGCEAAECASIIRINGIESTTNIQQITNDNPNTLWVDKVSNITALMAQYRVGAFFLIALAAIITTILLTLTKKIRVAIEIIATPILAVLSSVAVLGYLGISISIFNALALLLIFGVSIDYAIFSQFADNKHRPATLLAVTLSFVTTMLAFGLLCLSATPAIKTFGVTLIPGLSVAYALATSGAIRFRNQQLKTIK